MTGSGTASPDGAPRLPIEPRTSRIDEPLSYRGTGPSVLAVLIERLLADITAPASDRGRHHR